MELRKQSEHKQAVQSKNPPYLKEIWKSVGLYHIYFRVGIFWLIAYINRILKEAIVISFILDIYRTVNNIHQTHSVLLKSVYEVSYQWSFPFFHLLHSSVVLKWRVQGWIHSLVVRMLTWHPQKPGFNSQHLILWVCLHACNLSTRKMEEGGLEGQGHPQLYSENLR